ncbi:hypothetical protein J8J07_24350, partial [Mycobacterium tuberculosis]|nr:hypothetical protein [Mycobacterium tuberculosis]
MGQSDVNGVIGGAAGAKHGGNDVRKDTGCLGNQHGTRTAMGRQVRCGTPGKDNHGCFQRAIGPGHI